MACYGIEMLREKRYCLAIGFYSIIDITFALYINIYIYIYIYIGFLKYTQALPGTNPPKYCRAPKAGTFFKKICCIHKD